MKELALPRFLLDLRGVEQSGDYCCRANPNGNPRFHQLGTALLAGFVRLSAVCHCDFLKSYFRGTSMCARPTLEAVLY